MYVCMCVCVGGGGGGQEIQYIPGQKVSYLVHVILFSV